MHPRPVLNRRKLIEVALPLEAINTASAREKSIRHGHPSTLHLWWARRPLAAADQQGRLGEDWTGTKGLAEDVRRYGAWMRAEAERRIGALYPKITVTPEMVAERPENGSPAQHVFAPSIANDLGFRPCVVRCAARCHQ